MNVDLTIARDSIASLTEADRVRYIEAVAEAIRATYPRAANIIVVTGPDASCFVDWMCDNPDETAQNIARLADAVYHDPEGYGWGTDSDGVIETIGWAS